VVPPLPTARAEQHNIFGEPDVKGRQRNPKMRGADPAEAMALAVDRIVSARECAGALDRAIEAVVGSIGRFGDKNATSYLEAYRLRWS
jgi:hypothetical protein